MPTKTLAERQAELPPGLTPLLSIAQLAAYYGVSKWLIYQWINEGCPTEPSPTRGHRFDLDAVKAWAVERDTEDTAASA